MSDEYEDETNELWYICAVGRALSQEEFKLDLEKIIPKKDTNVTNIMPLDTDSERRRYIAIIVAKLDADEMTSLVDLFDQKMYAMSWFSEPNELEEYVTENYGDHLWGEIQEFPLTLEESEAYDVFLALIQSGKLALVRGTFDGKPVGLIVHPVHINNSHKTVPLAILANEDLITRIGNPLA